MSDINNCLISQDNGQLQIPYADYAVLMEKVQEGQRLSQVKDTVLSNLKNFLGGKNTAEAPAAAPVKAAPVVVQPAKEPTPVAEKVAVEFDAEKPVVKVEKSVEAAQEPVQSKPAPKGRAKAENINVPPIKKDISAHFNKLDESGRLFSVFKQYYTCLNDTCGGTVRVTMKDGFCSLWNYDEWEEFAYIDIFEGQLRVSIDPRYTSALQSLNFCEIPRLLSSRRNLVSVQVGDLNNTMLELLVKAFEEVGLTAS